jgi:glucosamine-6-phosphate deaminase
VAVKTPVRKFQVDALSVRVYPTQAAMAAEAAQMARQCLLEAIASRGSAAAILGSANSQITFVEALIQPGGVDWSRVTLFHMDEYLGIEAEHSGSLRCFMRERLERKLPLRTFHYLAGETLQPLDECDRYAALLRAQPIDLCVVGIGENGHVAFNDPAVADFADPRLVKIVKLDQRCRQQQVGEGHFPDLAAVPQYAITLTIPALRSARKLIGVVPETRKARAVRDALRGPVSTACPASILRRQAHCTLFLDEESASELENQPVWAYSTARVKSAP